ncbi:hypothetical protein [Streptomyces sp. NPDC005989]|uniref:hypothetical protein n=1 Tax=Streptomyces sp. NPDC005989 TaxID=3156727 RepID=UPI0033E273C9
MARAEAAIAGEDDEWLASLRADRQNHCASFHSEALHFSFPDEQDEQDEPDEQDEQRGTGPCGSVAPASQLPLSRCRAALR